MIRKATRPFLATVGALAVALCVAPTAFASSAATTLVSVSSSGQQANGDSFWPSISADGRLVAFTSRATNLDPSGQQGVYLRDRQTATTRLATTNADAYQPAISANGAFVAFTDNLNIYLDDVTSGVTTLVSEDTDGKPAGGNSLSPTISADGRFIAFSSNSHTLTPLMPTVRRNEFVRDMQTGKTQQVNVSSSGKPGNALCHHPSISADGRYVAFESNATNLVPGTKSKKWNIFVRDLKTQKTAVASLSSGGKSANGPSHNPSISGDGRYVAFESTASNLVKHDTNKTWDIFRRDLKTEKTTRVSVTAAGKQANGLSRYASLSNHGGFVAFESKATNLVKGSAKNLPGVFFRDMRGGKTTRVDVSSSGQVADRALRSLFIPPSISADGRYVAFGSPATNLVPGDANGHDDVFVRGPLHG
jgi:Tol biopolymer transport system component